MREGSFQISSSTSCVCRPIAEPPRMIARIRNWPWAVKLAVLLVAGSIVPLCALTIYTDVVMRRELVAVSSARDLQRARNTAALLDGYLQTLVADVTLVALASPTISV